MRLLGWGKPLGGLLLGITLITDSVSAGGFHGKHHLHSKHEFKKIALKPNSRNFRLNSSKLIKIKNFKKVSRRSLTSLKGMEEKIEKKIQKIGGIEVYGSRIIKHYIAKNHLSTFRKTIEETSSPQLPFISLDVAKSIAKENHQIAKSQGKLVLYPQNGKGVLSWKLEEVAFDSRKIVFIDALDGKELDSYDALTSAQVGMEGFDSEGELREFSGTFEDGVNKLIDNILNVKTHKHKSGKALPGVIVESSSRNISEPAAVDVHYYTSEVVRLLKEKFNRDGYDNNQAPIVSTVLYVRSGDHYINAFWNGRQLVYGKGDNETASDLSGALDVIAHEISHAITEKTSGLIYRNESGALNEAFSDIMGTYFEYLIQPDKFDWKLGEDVWTPEEEGDALRYMDDPTKDGSSRDHYSTRYTGWGDNGGVHINSGIANLAFYLMSEGGVHPQRDDNIVVDPIGIELATKIIWKAFTEFLSPNATFQDARDASVYVAKFEGQHIAEQVHLAWKAVGVDGEAPTEDEDEEEPQPEPKVVVLRNNVPVRIPDRSPQGIESVINVPSDVSEIKININIEHTYIGDLWVRIVSPEGKTYNISQRKGGNKDNLLKQVNISLKSDESSKGDWTLKVSDHAFWDKGTLQAWAITYTE